MNAIHKAILDFLRETHDPKLTSLVALPDIKIIHRLFSNHRGQRGVRLTRFGLQIMQGYFHAYAVNVPEDEVIKPVHLVFLDDRVMLPYYFDDDQFILFDYELAFRLRLANGRLSVLVSIETN